MTREQSARQTLEVDDGLHRKARGGDAVAAKLWYEIHGWSPKQNLEITKGRDKELDGKANFDLLRELVKGLSPAEKAELMGSVPQGAIESKPEAFGSIVGGCGGELKGGGGGGGESV